MEFLKKCVLIVMLVMLSGCATVSPSSPVIPQKALTFTPYFASDGSTQTQALPSAVVHLYRPDTDFQATEFLIKANGVEVGILKKGGCLRFPAIPGDLEVTAQVQFSLFKTGILDAGMSPQTIVKLKIESGNNYYIRAAGRDEPTLLLHNQQTLDMVNVPPPEGQRGVQSCKPCGVKEDSGKENFAMSCDGKRSAYVTAADKKWQVIVDGTSDQPYDDIAKDSIVFSPDGKRMAYVATTNKKWFVVVDGKTGQPYDDVNIRSMVFSANGERMAYMARENKQWFVVIDGDPEQPCDNLIPQSLLFSPDGRRIAYMASKNKKWFVVLDGKAEQSYADLRIDSLVFSPDSKSVKYTAKVGGGMG